MTRIPALLGALAVFLIPAGCSDDNETPVPDGGISSDTGDGESGPACDILDRDLLREVTGGIEVTLTGGLPSGREREVTGFECRAASADKTYLSVHGADLEGDSDRQRMAAQFGKEATDIPDCVQRTDDPAGYVCEQGERTLAALVFDERWIRVTAQPHDVDRPVEPELLIAIAENVNDNIDAHDAERRDE